MTRTERWRSERTALRVSVPQTRRERARGLLGRDGLAPGEALFLERCRSILTIGMRFAIDVAWLDPDLQVVRLRLVRPGRVTAPHGRHVLELAAGSDVRPGDRFVRATGPGRPDAGPSLYSGGCPREGGTRAPIV